MDLLKLLAFSVAVTLCLTASAQVPYGDNSWNFRMRGINLFDSNESWLRPWQSGQPQPPWPSASEDGNGRFVKGEGYPNSSDASFGWDGISKRPGGSFSYSSGKDYQFHAWTYLYVKEATTIGLNGGCDCVPNSFLNGNFDSGRLFTNGRWDSSLNLIAGWNRIDLTGYNQNNNISTGTNNLAALVDFMDSDAAFLDFGDAPAPYPTLLKDDGARHKVKDGVFLGSLVDFEPGFDGLPDAMAQGDDRDGLPDDEDGVGLPRRLVAGRVTKLPVIASVAGKLSAWLDTDGIAGWTQAEERIFADQPLVAGSNQLSFTVPTNAIASPKTFARFRFSTDSGLGPTGPASNGEVEDYAVAIFRLQDVFCPEVGMNMQGAVNGGSAVIGGIDLSFANVAETGCVTAEYIVAPPAEVPDEFTFLLRPGNPLQLWDIEFDGTFDGPATLTFRYNDSILLGPERNLKVFHQKSMDGVEMLTTVAHDLVNNTITVNTSSFSLIALAVIPEPSTGVLGVVGTVLICGLRRTATAA